LIGIKETNGFVGRTYKPAYYFTPKYGVFKDIDCVVVVC
jgi:hypothetical protein